MLIWRAYVAGLSPSCSIPTCECHAPRTTPQVNVPMAKLLDNAGLQPCGADAWNLDRSARGRAGGGCKEEGL